MFPLEPICSWPMFKYVNERCCWCPINVIIFDIQHLRVWCSFSASDGTWWPEIFEQHDIWSIKKDQPSIPSMGRDLILGAAAAGSSRPTAIKLGMILKMLGMNRTWQFQRGGQFREMGSGGSWSSLPPLDCISRLNRFSLTDQSATFLGTFHISMPQLPWWALPDTNRLWNLASDRCCPKFSSRSPSFPLLPFRSNLLAVRKLTPLTSQWTAAITTKKVRSICGYTSLPNWKKAAKCYRQSRQFSVTLKASLKARWTCWCLSAILGPFRMMRVKWMTVSGSLLKSCLSTERSILTHKYPNDYFDSIYRVAYIYI